jgi:hypothetical protein
MLSFLHLDVVLPIASGVVAGAIVALKFISPKTKTTVDDMVLKRLEQLETLIGMVPNLPKAAEKGKAPTTVSTTATGTTVRDHR